MVGTLTSVRNISIDVMNNYTHVTWKTPYHYLDYIPAPTHYCIDIFKTNGVTLSMHLLSDCNVQNTSYVYYYQENEIGQCYFLKFSITPINLVGNGTISTMLQEHNFRSGKKNILLAVIYIMIIYMTYTVNISPSIRSSDVTVQTKSKLNQLIINISLVSTEHSYYVHTIE